MARVRAMQGADAPLRLFFDAGAIIEGCVSQWSAAKALLILAVQTNPFRVILADEIEREVLRAVSRRQREAPATETERFATDVTGWFARARIERLSSPSAETVAGLRGAVLPALRHTTDLLHVAAALAARPDWVISTNTAHWDDALAARTGLRIATPRRFLRDLLPVSGRQ